MKLAVILESGKEWHSFSKAASALESALRTASVEPGSPEERSANALNFEMVNDIQFTIEKLQKQLDRLDKRYKWREYMTKKRERVFPGKQ